MRKSPRELVLPIIPDILSPIIIGANLKPDELSSIPAYKNNEIDFDLILEEAEGVTEILADH